MIRQSEIEKLIIKGFDLELIAFELDLPIEYILECNKNIGERTLEYNSTKESDKEESAFTEIKMLRKQGRYEEAEILGEKFSNNEKIQSQMITIYMREGKIEEAKEIGRKFQDVPLIQSQILIYNRAKTYDKEIMDNPVIIEQIDEEIKHYMAEEFLKTKSNLESLKQILNRIYNNPNDQTILEDINNLDDNWLKLILNSALGEKTNIKSPAQQFIKNLKQQGYVDEEHMPLIYALEKRLKQNTKIFDRGFYWELISKAMKKESIENRETVDTQDGR